MIITASLTTRYTSIKMHIISSFSFGIVSRQIYSWRSCNESSPTVKSKIWEAKWCYSFEIYWPYLWTSFAVVALCFLLSTISRIPIKTTYLQPIWAIENFLSFEFKNRVMRVMTVLQNAVIFIIWYSITFLLSPTVNPLRYNEKGFCYNPAMAYKLRIGSKSWRNRGCGFHQPVKNKENYTQLCLVQRGIPTQY